MSINHNLQELHAMEGNYCVDKLTSFLIISWCYTWFDNIPYFVNPDCFIARFQLPYKFSYWVGV